MSLISAGSISLDSTFKQYYTVLYVSTHFPYLAIHLLDLSTHLSYFATNSIINLSWILLVQVVERLLL